MDPEFLPKEKMRQGVHKKTQNNEHNCVSVIADLESYAQAQ